MPGLAAGDEDRVDRHPLEDAPAGRLGASASLSIADAGEAGHLVDIGREQRRAGEDRGVGLLGVDDDGDAGLACASAMSERIVVASSTPLA